MARAKRLHDSAFRRAFVAAFGVWLKGRTIGEAAVSLGLTRQAIWAFKRGKFYPRSEVLRLLIDRGLVLDIGHFVVTPGAFPASQPAAVTPVAVQLQLPIEEILEKIDTSNFVVKSVTARGSALEIKLEILLLTGGKNAA